ncbi:uncharacterized protein LOC142784744 [Rhipicephalus microplus]|uniref:uncharacterized protein LOC142784744 n=1 Tax=Rhipicephalus microplus TaxID=6941 RepID=UPI003F6C44E9
MSLAKGAVDKHQARAFSSRSSQSQFASLWRHRFSPSSGNSRIIPGRLPQRIGVMRGDAAAAGGYSASALHGTDAHLLSRAYYTTDFDVATQHEGVSCAPKVALVVTAIVAMFLIGAISLFIMSKDISANILAHNDYRVGEYDGFDPASSRSPHPDVRVREKIIAGHRETASTRRGTVTASKATLGSSTPRSDQHHHGPRYADDGVSETTDRATEAPAATTIGSAERTEEAAAKTDTEQPPKHGCYVALHKYCVKVRDEYYYQPAVNACVMTPTDSTVVCNHSRNKFVSHASCRKDCVESAVPAEKCFHTATFSMCTRRDVRHKWWYYDGSRCQPWNFPLGACPSLTDADGGEAFTSRHECAQLCEGAGDQQQHHLRHRCIPPVREPCTAHQLR